MFAQTIEVIKQPNVYKAMTPYGSFVCKRSTAPANRLAFVGNALHHLHQRGWDGAVLPALTKYNEPFVQRGESTYYLTAWLPQQVPLAQWPELMARRLAELHQLSQNYRFDDPRQVEPLIESMLAKWTQWLEQMKNCLEIARGRTYPSPVDVVFLANEPFLAEAAATSIQLLREWKERHRTHAHFRLSINHGSPYPPHLLLDRTGSARLINFDRARYDTPTRDLTLYYRTYFQQIGDEEEASRLFEQYTNIFPLRPEETDLLAIFLHYPERIMRDIEGYYLQKQGWSELYAVNRFEKDIDRFMRMSRWIRHTF
nr:aminoglycoside phosphotransferase family protein [Brevibacillus fulvus]